MRLAKREPVWSVEPAAPEPVVAGRATGPRISGLFVPQYLLDILTGTERLDQMARRRGVAAFLV